ncbi:hypothetical protein Lal_00026456 [Lupinus albus]|uniref:Putative encoded peptide n=1 Tax=Lupinus albus TaxID=3870 RepID=A0A6A4PYJ5_LUPAL|nr:putative encoded peptide [Lupinus albus]KAF1861960.1 hypothetical protein Lal_00026456 [Lupinus albus]
MASFTRICLLFALLFLYHELMICIEGRNLREHIHSPNTATSPTKSVVATPSQLKNSVKSEEGHVEAFRPTTPGNSPGVGHPIKNQSIISY